MSETMQIDYKHLLDYAIGPVNAVGVSTSMTLRTVTTYNDGNCLHVKKFGTVYSITDVTNISDPGVANLTFKVYAYDGTLLGTRANGGAFVDGSTVTAQGCYLECEASGGAATLPANMTLTTDVDGGGLTVILSGETLGDGDTVRFYISSSGSTYYDQDMKYGGGRHTETGVAKYPFFTIAGALADPGATGYAIITVLDSESYDEEITISTASMIIQAALGYTPKLINGAGARLTSEVSAQFNNSDTVYYNTNGDDSTGDGTWQNPYRTVTTAYNNLGGKAHIVYGGDGCVTGGVYAAEQIGSSENVTVETDYGYICTYRNDNPATTYCLNTGFGDLTIRGFIFDANSINRGLVVGANGDVTIYDCTAMNSAGAPAATANNDNITVTFNNLTKACNIHHCRTYSGGNGIKVQMDTGSVITADIYKNLCYDNIIGIYLLNNAGGITLNGDVKHNVIYRNSSSAYGIYLRRVGTGYTCNADIFNNTIYDMARGIFLDANVAMTGTIDENILHSCSNHGIYVSVAVNGDYNCYYNNGTDHNANLTSTNEINDNPDFCSINNDFYGLSADSPCLKADGSENDVGAVIRIITIAEDDIVLNGLYIDGGSFYNTGGGMTGAPDYSGGSFKWLTIQNLQGIAADIYSGTDTTWEIVNSVFYNIGNATKFTRGGNDFKENLVYECKAFGVHSDYTYTEFDHNSFYDCGHGIYLESNSGGIKVKNSIFFGNVNYDIYSEVSLFVYNSMIKNYNTNVTVKEEDGNISDDPLFVNVTDGEEDFHLMSEARRVMYNSPCLDQADDDYDMGCYLETREISDESWQQYVFDHNPRGLDPVFEAKAAKKIMDSLASSYPNATGFKKKWPLKWGRAQYTTEEDWKAVRMLHKFRSTPWNDLVHEDIVFRLHPLPDSFMDSGTCTIDVTNKQITASGKAYTEDEWEGWSITVKFFDMASSTVDATNKKFTKSGAGFATDEWNGYYVEYNGHRLLITDTSGDDIYVSDPDGVLSDGTYSTFIEFSFKCESNTAAVFTVLDPYSKLLETNEGFYISFIRVVLESKKFQTRQFGRYIETEETRKTGYGITVEQE